MSFISVWLTRRRGRRDGVSLRRLHDALHLPLWQGQALRAAAEAYAQADWMGHTFARLLHDPEYILAFVQGYLVDPLNEDAESYPHDTPYLHLVERPPSNEEDTSC